MSRTLQQRRVDQIETAQDLADKHFGRPVRLVGAYICNNDSERTVVGRIKWDSDDAMCLYGADGKMFAYISLPAE